MRERILTLFMTIAILFTTITPGLVPSAEAAGGTVTKTYTATADTMQLNGQAEYNGIYDNDGDGYLYVGMSNNDGFVNVRNRMAASFNLGAPEGTIVSAELVVTVATVLRVPNHTLYMEARGSAANSLDHNFNGTFPFVDVNSPFSDKFTAKSTAEVPMGTYLQDQSITFNVKSAVDAFTGGSDRTVTFTLNGNEADADSGRFLLYSLEASNAAFRPKLVVTYETGPTNTPPTGSFKIAEGTATSASTVNLSVTGSDPDAGDSVTHMRFANSVANLSAASWLPFSNTATFSLSGGDGAKNIYMQVRDSNNAISASSSQIILLDQTAPTGALIINDGAAWTKSEMVTLKGTYTDGSGSGVEQVRLSNVNGTWQTSWFSIADLNGRSWVLPAGQGVKNVYVQYKDRVGNSSNSTISSTITVDTIAPVITNVVNNIVYNSKVNPLFYEGSGLLNGSPYTSGTDITQDGTYTLIVTDQAGNSATVVFKVDTIAPTVTGIANGVIYNTIKTITFNKGTATLNGAAFVSGAQVSQDGVYTLIVTDTAGNVTTINFEIDTTAPKIKGVSEGGVYKSVTPSFNEGTAQLNGTAYMSGTRIDQDGVYTLVVTDTVGNVTTVNFEIENVAPIVTGVMEGGIYISVVPSFNEGTAQLNGTAYTSGTKIDQDGVYTLVVTDAAGNVTMVKFIIDRTAPTVTGVVYGVSYNTDRTITFNEGTATLNGDPFASGETVSAEGDYTLIVTDAVGNVTTVSFTIHKTGPTVTGVVYGSSYNTDRMITFNTGIATLNGDSFASGSEVSAEGDYTLIVTDAMGNVTTIAFTIDKTVPIISGVTDGSIYNTNQSITFNEGTATLNGDPFASGATIFAEGDYTLVVTDEAGNVTTANFIIDRTAPTVTGVVYGVSYNTDRTITFNEGTATLNGDPFASGETVSAEGNYTLIVTDAVGNVTTVSFTIHKTGPTVTGVVYGSSYNTDRMITFNTGIATLNGDSFASGSEVSAEGDYTLIVTDAMGNVTTIAFTIDKTVPIISGVTDGSIYNTNQSITFNEGTATLNGDPFASGATIFAEGDYTLVVTDEAGNVTTANFIIDRTAPTVTGVVYGVSYNTDRTITFNEGTATLNGDPFASGETVSAEGNYTLIVTDAVGNVTTVSFTIHKTGPTVNGVVYGSSYNTDRMITFNTGIATLNGDPFASGSEVSAEGDYTLIVTDAMGNVTTIAFTIDKTVPIISGVTDGSIYNTNQSITFNEGTATLNGDPFASGATVFAEGDYTLVVTDEAGNVTMISFTIDRTNPIITGLTVGISNYTSPLTIGFNEGTATLNGQPFTTGTRVISSGNYTLVVIDEAGNQTIATFTLNISTPESGSGSSSDPSTSSSTSPIPSLGLEIEINGVKQKDLAKETTAVMNGKKVTTVTIDEKKLSRYLDSLPDKPVINIPVHNDSDRVLLLLNGQLITTLNDRNAVILIQTELGSYLLAANRIDWSLVTKRFGSEDALRNMVIQVEITNVPESDIVQLANSIGKARLLSPPIDFNITAAHGGKTIELNKFLSYVERTIVIPNSADDHNKNITGITMTKDGNIVPVPTRMMRENGKTFAVIYSLTNSVYAVIENDKTFADIQNHWAKYDIEQVASKLIVQGVTESSFQPNKQITRAEFTAMLVRALGLHTVDQPTSFTDVNSGQWYYETVSIAEGYGLVTASNNSQYTPNEKLSREEAMVLLGKAMKLAGMDTAISDSEAAQQLSTFKDHHLLDLSARAAAALNVKYGIIIGNQGQLTPNNVITRAEATVILQRLLEAAKLSS
ncbi:S-layer homology domain-containing protein [Paenibacillus sp. FSL E2-0177]|uniref:S-layer homology domain-containing protein n=1 Tax=Paenibacillus sp. FSL E2-0177 TaxID=2921360 RepID=UPI0030EB9053